MTLNAVLLRSGSLVLLAGAVLASTACSDYRSSQPSTTSRAGADMRMDSAQETINRFRSKDSTLGRFFDTSYGYAVFPKITKGAAGIGAANGKDGVVYEQGQVVGYAEMSQVTIGAQLGGQDFSEIVFFQDRAALDEFKRNRTEFSANASAVGATSGAAAASDFSHGVAVFTDPIGGLMFEASIGGQKFRYWPR